MHSLLKAILIPCLLSCLWLVNAFAESGPITLNVDIPSGQWKAALSQRPIEHFSAACKEV
jgi:hypothetical protein